MGTFTYPIRLAGLDTPEAREIEAMVDTGAFYTTLPERLCNELGVAREGSQSFLLADGRRVEFDYGQAWATIGDKSVVTIVVFGTEEAPALLGAYTLEGFCLAVDPVNQCLVPITPLMC